MKKSKSKSKSKQKSKTKTPPSTKLGNHLAPSIAVTNQIAMKMLSIDEELIAGLSEEEINRRNMIAGLRMRRRLFGSSDEEEEEEEEEKEQEQEWTLERMKRYYYTGIHDHSKCEEAEEQRQLRSCYYYKLEAQYDDNLIHRLASGPVSLPPSCFPV